MIRRSLAVFSGHGEIGLVQPVIHPDDQDALQRSAGFQLLPPVFGGATRQASVARASRRSRAQARHRARPRRGPAVRVGGADLAGHRRGAKAARRCRHCRLPTPSRGSTPRAKSPVRSIASCCARADAAGVRFAAILEAHRRAPKAARDDFTDDAALAEWAGMKVSMFAGEPRNVKLTTPRISRAPETQASPTWGTDRLRYRRPRLRRRRSHHARRRAIPHRAVSPAIPTPTWRCTAWTRSSAHLPTAISACIFRPAIRDGAAPPPTASWHSRSSAYARAAGDRASRHHGRMRGAAHRPASRCDAREDRRDRRHLGRARGDQGDHQREDGLHRPWRRHRRNRDRDGRGCPGKTERDDRWRRTDRASHRPARALSRARSYGSRPPNPAPAASSPRRSPRSPARPTWSNAAS